MDIDIIDESEKKKLFLNDVTVTEKRVYISDSKTLSKTIIDIENISYVKYTHSSKPKHLYEAASCILIFFLTLLIKELPFPKNILSVLETAAVITGTVMAVICLIRYALSRKAILVFGTFSDQIIKEMPNVSKEKISALQRAVFDAKDKLKK